MNKSISIALFVVGLVLTVLGFFASDSISSDFSRLFTGAPTEKAIWLLIVGLLCAITGGAGLLRGGRTA